MHEQHPTSLAEWRARTVPGRLCELARERPDDIAFRSKDLGVYRERSWLDYAGMVARCAAAFKRLGLKSGERVAIMGDPCEEWVITDLAAQALGCVTYGIYPTASPQEVEYQMGDGGAVLFVAENQEYVDKLLGVAENLPALRHIVVIDDKAMFAYDDARLLTYDALVSQESAGLDWLQEQAAQLDPMAPAFIIYTSGTTGAPKGAVISQGKHLAAVYGIVEQYPVLSKPGQRAVVFLPICHVLGRDVAVTLPMMSGLVPHYGEDMDDLANTLFEVAPTVMFSVPRYLQKFISQILLGISNTTPIKRAAYEWAMGVARRQATRRWEPGYTGDSLAYRLAWALVFRPILNKMGFDQLELVISGGAPLPAETGHIWQAYGINVLEMYGQTEAAGGIIAGQKGPFPRPGTVGTITNEWTVRFSEEGEILVHSADLFDGYWNNSEATQKTFTEDGWLRTGDIGHFEEGDELRLVDRARDFIVTSGGKTISPSYVENALMGSQYLSEVVVFGQGRKYLSALVEIDYDMVADWARANDIAYSGFTNLAQNPRVEQLIEAEIAKGNEKLARVEQIKKFRILAEELDPEKEGEPVTPTRKVKRNLMFEKYRTLVESMYDDREERMVAQALAGRKGAPAGAGAR